MYDLDTHSLECFMREALLVAEKGRWTTAPNPCVGAVLVCKGKIVAHGAHLHYGGLHAERVCIDEARIKGVPLAESTLVVTLEPCNHEGKQPPCTELLLACGIRHVVIGAMDTNPVAGGGAARLREAGISVETGILEQECKEMAADFFVWQQQKRPYGLLKMASTIDGRIATRTGGPETISCEASRKYVMRLRANIGIAGGAILVGGNTFRLDNPRLTARVEGGKSPLAVVVTNHLPGPDKDAYLINFRPEETIFFTSKEQSTSPEAMWLQARGTHVFGVGPSIYQEGSYTTENRYMGNLHMREIYSILWEKFHCPYVLCEGGGTIAFSLLKAGLVDVFHYIVAPYVLGDKQAQSVFSGSNGQLLSMEDSCKLSLSRMERMGDDALLVYHHTDKTRDSRVCSPA